MTSVAAKHSNEETELNWRCCERYKR